MSLAAKTILPFFLALLLLSWSGSFAQEKHSIHGTVLDSLENTPLDSCIVSLKVNDEQMHTLTNVKGHFSFNILLQDSALLLVRRAGFTDFSKKISLRDSVVNAGKIFLVPASRLMENIVVRKQVPAIVMREDTMEYTVDSFPTRRGDMVEDLIRLLPGIEIDEDGNLLHNGKPINRILVDGEDFFGGNKNISLKNLPVDIISKIQVMDTKTKEQVFNHLQSDGEEKTLNIKTKPGRKSFGTAGLSAGTNRQMGANAMRNVLNDNKGYSVIGSYNTTRFNGITGAHNQLGSATRSLGANYNNKIGKGIMVNGNLSYNNNNNEQESGRQLEQHLTADSTLTTNNYGFSKFGNSNYGGTVSMEALKENDLMVNLVASYNKGKNESRSTNQYSSLENGRLKNAGMREASGVSENNNLSFNVSISKKLNKKGRSVSVNLRSFSLDQQSNQFSNSNTTYSNGNSFYNESLRQHLINSIHQQSVGVGISYIEQFSKKWRLQLSENIDINSSNTDRATYTIDSLVHEERPDTAYSNKWSSRNTKQVSQASLLFDAGVVSLTTGIQMNTNFSERVMENRDKISQRQVNYSPSLTTIFKLDKSRVLRLNFSGSTSNPTIEQLQPVPDNSNPLFVRIGNPNLKTSFTQSYGFSYNYLSTTSGNLFSASISYAPVSNAIVNAIYYDTYLRRTSQFINVNGVYNARGTWNFSRKIGSSKAGTSWGFSGNGGFGQNVFFEYSNLLYTHNYSIRHNFNYSMITGGKKRSRLNATLGFNYSRTVSPSKTTAINSRNFALVPKLDWTRNLKWLEIKTSYQLSCNRISYSGANANNMVYSDHMFSNNMSARVEERGEIESAFSYRYNGRTPAGLERHSYVWNLSASWQVFNNRRGSVRVAALDILNSGSSFSRTVGDNYVEDVQSSFVKRYFTVGFQYNWTKLEKKNYDRPARF